MNTILYPKIVILSMAETESDMPQLLVNSKLIALSALDGRLEMR